MNKRKVKIIVIVCIIVILMVTFLPLPLPVYKKYNGIRINGETKTDVTIIVRMWNFHYLFKSDKLEGKISIFEENKENEEDENRMLVAVSGSYSKFEDDIIFMTGVSFQDKFYFSQLYFGESFNKIFISTNDENDGKIYYSASKSTSDPMDGYNYINSILTLE